MNSWSENSTMLNTMINIYILCSNDYIIIMKTKKIKFQQWKNRFKNDKLFQYDNNNSNFEKWISKTKQKIQQWLTEFQQWTDEFQISK